MRFFIRTVHALSLGCGVGAVICIAAALLVACEMVLARYVFQAATYWQTEFVTYATVAATFIGCPYVLLVKGHITVDALPASLSHRMRTRITLLVAVLSFGFCLVIAWYSWAYLLAALEGGWRTETVWRIPLWIPIVPMAVGMSLSALQYIADMLAHCVAWSDESS